MAYTINKTFAKLLPENLERYKEPKTEGKEEISNFENFKARVYKNIKYNRYAEPNEEESLDFDALLLTIYELPTNVYKKIRVDSRIDYAVIKKNALLINKIITCTLANKKNPVEKINEMTEMLNRKKSVANMIFSSIDPNLNENDEKYLEAINLAVTDEDRINEIKNQFTMYFYKAINDDLLSEFFFEQLDDIVPEMYRQIKVRTGKYYAWVDHEEKTRYNQFKESVIYRKDRTKGKINQVRF